MRTTALALLATLAALAALALAQGTDVFGEALRSSTRQLLRFLPLLVVAVMVAGFAETLLPRGVVEAWLSDASGWRGILLAWAAGVLTPGGSIIGLPLIAALWKAGAGLSVLMTYATSFALLSLLRLPIEIGFYGWRLTAIRVGVSLVLPLVAGFLTQLLLPALERS